MPATPSERAFAARVRNAARAASGGAGSAPNSARLRTRLGSATARCCSTIVPIEWPTQCARAMFSRAHTASAASTMRASDSSPSTRCERPLPGKSRRTHAIARERRHQRREAVRRAAQAVHAHHRIAAAFVLDGDAIESVKCHATTRTVLDRADAVDLDAHHVARFQPLRRVEPHADAGRRAGRDDVARVQGDAARAGLDQHVGCRRSGRAFAGPGAIRR